MTFTRVLSATINKEALVKPNWAGILFAVVKQVKSKGFTAEALSAEILVPTKSAVYDDEGYKYYPELEISIQGQSASDAWREISRLADKHQIPVEVEFQWRENEKAQHPGSIGIIRAGS